MSTASHEKVVDLIRSSGKLVTMTVVSRSPSNTQDTFDKKYEWQTSAPLGYATLPNKLRKHRSSSAGRYFNGKCWIGLQIQSFFTLLASKLGQLLLRRSNNVNELDLALTVPSCIMVLIL